MTGEGELRSSPATGPSHTFSSGTAQIANQAADAAAEAFKVFGVSSRSERATLLRTIAAELEKNSGEIVELASGESGLPVGRIQGELGRTTGQLRLFADHIEDGDYLDRRVANALPEREPLPRPELRTMMRPLGPVAVFGASNFPLAFSTAGGDTAAALAAGCPVVVKSHPAHPGTGELVAQAVLAAMRETGTHLGTFSFLQDAGHTVATSLVQHPAIKAVGFTGSLTAGRILFDLCAARAEPIPFFGELGSINPCFVLPTALATGATRIGAEWAASLTLGAGQFCTSPGVMFVVDGDGADSFIESTLAALGQVDKQTMLTDAIASTFRTGAERLAGTDGVHRRFGEQSFQRSVTPYLFETDGETWNRHAELAEEVFGPLGIVVRTRSFDELLACAQSLSGQLTATLHFEQADDEAALQLLPVLEHKAGRLLANGFPTGVEVDPAMVHGGPYPAATNPAATSVGTLAIRRFLRPVCYQNLPQRLLPADLQDA